MLLAGYFLAGQIVGFAMEVGLVGVLDLVLEIEVDALGHLVLVIEQDSLDLLHFPLFSPLSGGP